jgi:hypothetical protein
MKLILAMNEQIERLIEKYFRARLKKLCLINNLLALKIIIFNEIVRYF